VDESCPPPPEKNPDDFFDPLDPCEDFLSHSDWKDIARVMRLTPRELQVARLLFEDNGRGSIARQLGCNLETARAHIDRIFEKLAVKSRLQFALRVVRVHLLLKKPE
jgi:DNA-binding CsgD family transcriptional regulator